MTTLCLAISAEQPYLESHKLLRLVDPPGPDRVAYVPASDVEVRVDSVIRTSQADVWYDVLRMAKLQDGGHEVVDGKLRALNGCVEGEGNQTVYPFPWDISEEGSLFVAFPHARGFYDFKDLRMF